MEDGPILEIEGLSSEGAGVSRLPDGRTVFVHRTVPGDRVRIELTKSKKRWARGRLLEVVEPGPARREPPCAYAGRCGGCTLEQMEYTTQLEAKQTRIHDALTRIGGLEALPAIEMHASPREFGYRNRASFSLVRGGGDRVYAGFHGLEDPGRIVDLGGDCQLLEASLGALWDELRDRWGPGAARLPDGRRLRLTLRSLSDGTGFLLVEGGIEGGDAAALVHEIEGLRAVWAAPEQGDPPILVAGEEALFEHWYGERIPIRPGAFLQVNRDAAEHLHDLVLREVGRPRGLRVLDAYCGFGVYGRRLARHGASAVGIELDPQAILMGRAEAVEGFELLEGRVEDRIAEGLPADRVILNPPRAGVEEGVMEALSAQPPARLIYVSCDPATLARDLARLGGAMRLLRVQGVDLFPQTPHVETVVTLEAPSPEER
ncbi:MAG: class I SAM-dependent RNA methyltransferase [Gemmatimonadales bacterium]|nr:MAG: class I SAM-dependent RNA methyltransferase [Gemmatimonadales bacterium]